MSATPPDAEGITNLMILQHMQSMRSGLERRVDGMRKALENRMDRMENTIGGVKEGIIILKKDMVHVTDALQRLYTHRVKMLGRIEHLEEVVGIAQ